MGEGVRQEIAIWEWGDALHLVIFTHWEKVRDRVDKVRHALHIAIFTHREKVVEGVGQKVSVGEWGHALHLVRGAIEQVR